jgi:PAS domain S-box-containing protein
MLSAAEEDPIARREPVAPYALLFLFLVFAVAVAGVFYFYHRSQTAAIEREVRNELLTVADMKVAQITEWRDARLGSARSIMADAMSLEAMRRFLAHGGASDRAQILAWLQSMCNHAPYADAILADAQGRAVLSVGSVMGDESHVRRIVAEVLQRNEPVWRDFYRDDPSRPVHLGVNIPLRLGSGAPFGALLLGLDPNDFLYPFIRRWPTPSRTAETFLVRRDGQDILHLSDVRGQPGSALNMRLPLTRSDVPAVRAVLGTRGNFEGPDYSGAPVFAAARPVPGTPWFLVAKIDAEEVRGPIARRATPEAIAALDLILLVAAGVVFLWRRQQARFYRDRYRAEVERRALIGHYDYLSRFANDAILLMDEAGHIVEANDRALDLYGYTRDEFLALNIRDLVHTSEIDNFDDHWNEAKDRKALLFEKVHARRDGSALPVEVSSRRIEVEGKVFRQSIIRDITERRRAEAALRESEDRFRQVVEGAPEGIMVETDGRVQYLNPAALRLMGAHSASQLLGRPMLENIHPEEREEVVRRNESLARGEPVPAAERRFLRADGSESVGIVSVTRIVYDGRPATVVFFHDIAESKRAQAALRESEDRFRQVVESAPEGIIVESDRRMQYLNPVALRLLGAHSASQLLGRPVGSIIHPDDHEVAEVRAVLVDRGEWVPPAERRFLRLDGSELVSDTSITHLEYNQRPAILIFLRDISDRKRAEAEHALLEAQLRQAQKMESVGRLAGGVAHDFNNHLTVINGYCDMLQASFPEGDPVRESIDEIRAAGERAAALTQQLLAFSRQQIAEPKPVSLNDVVADAGRMLRRLIGADIEIVTDLAAEPAVVLADRGQMNQVLMNLAVNARDAMPAGGKLIIETRLADVGEEYASLHPNARPGRFVVLSVSDTGVGMDREVIQRIFEPFFTTKKTGAGTGLGLATVYGIIRHSGGWITAASEPGRGACFRVYLAADARPAEPASIEAGHVRDGRGSETVLLVEDHPEVLRLTREILRQKGYRLLEAANGAEALAVAAGHPGTIDALVTDVVMPGMNGRELAARLLELRPLVKVLFTSGYAAGALGSEGALDPGMAYLPKPFTAAELALKLRQVIEEG